MKRIMCLLLTVFLITLTACGATPLPSGFTEEDVLTKAENVVTLLSAKDYNSVCELFNAQMKESLDANGLEDALGTQIDSLGAFKEFKTEATQGGSDSSIGDYAIAVLICEYEEGSATYTISIDSSGNVCGLYMK